MEKFCDWPIKCVEDAEETWTCTAHLDSARALQCHFSPKDIKLINGKKFMTKQGSLFGCCRDWEEMEP